jgi:hypothetical protein
MQRRPLAVAVAVLVAGLALAGCKDNGGTRVASADGGAGPTASTSAGPRPAADPEERQRQYQRCMHERGFDVSNNGSAVTVDGSPLTKEAFAKAYEACRIYAPDGGDLHKFSPEDVEKWRQFAKCMREHGVPEFPDPNADGEIDFLGDPKKYPNVVTAGKACQSLAPAK